MVSPMTAPIHQTNARWLVLLVWWPLMAGCGGGSQPASQPVVAPPPPPPKAVAVAGPQPAAAPQPAQPAEGDEDSPQAAPVSFVSKFPKESIEDVFLTDTVGTPMTASAAPLVNSGDQFSVEFGDPTTNSSQFAVSAGAAVSEGTPRADFKLPSGFTVDPSFGYSSDGYPLRIRCSADSKQMAFVPGGTAKLGSNQGPAEATPEVEVFLDPFYMDVTEVTVEEYEKFRTAQRDGKKRVPPPPLNGNSGAKFPASGVAWGDANIYARWAGKQLPSEAQFEKAARGPSGFPHPWGFGRAVWATPRQPSTISVVARYAGDVSMYGIYDLAGNLREWTNDWYSPTAHQELAKQSITKTITNWAGPKQSAQSSQRVIKSCGPQWEVWYRSGGDMGDRKPDLGFRCILPITPAPATSAS